MRVLSRTALGLSLLVLPGVLLTATAVALLVVPVFGVPLSLALMVGAVRAATDPIILISLVDDIRLKSKVAQTIIAESGFRLSVSSS